MQVLKFAGCAGVATGSILVYAYILIYYIKNRGFRGGGYLKEGFMAFCAQLPALLVGFLIADYTDLHGFFLPQRAPRPQREFKKLLDADHGFLGCRF